MTIQISSLDIFRETHVWACKQFRPDGGDDPRGAISHLKKEVDELYDTPFDLTEYADCAMLLFDACQIAGYTPEQLLEAVAVKLEINKNREWGEPDENGVVEHVRG
jgi:hypothetical protein